jgi:TonB family protein
MLDILVSSRPPHLLKPRGAFGSLLTHALVLGMAVQATRATVGARLVPLADTTLVFLQRLAPPPVRPAEPQRAPAAQDQAGGSIVLLSDPPPKGFQTVLAPTDIPSSIPPVDLTAKPLDPRDYSGRGMEGGVANGVVGGTGKVDADVPSGDAIYLATTEDSRFAPAVLISQPIPKYPPALGNIGLSGRVLLQFIVDTTGTVDPASIRVVESTNEGFEAPARESVEAARFHPARLGSHPVRQRAQQSVRFTVAHHPEELSSVP